MRESLGSRILLINPCTPFLCLSSTGDVLVFLTGRDEIERACDELFQRSEKLDYRYDVRVRRLGDNLFKRVCAISILTPFL